MRIATGSCKKMKYLFIIDNLGSGGAQVQLLNLVKSLRANDDKVVVMMYASNGEKQFFENQFTKLNVKLQYHSKKPGFRLSVLRSIYESLSKESYDCAISILPNSSFYLTLTKIFYFSKTPQISWEMSIFGIHSKITEFLVSYIANFLSSAIICNSITQKKILSKFPFLKSKLYFVANGIETSSLNKLNKNYNKPGKNILVVARLSEPKNGLNFVKGLRIFSEKNNWCPQISWVGRIDKGSKHIECSMNKVIQNTPLIKEKWNWVGVVKDIRPYYYNATCMVLPSKWEGVPNVVGEAMLCKCPVIATKVSDLPIILSEQRGIGINGFSPEAIASALDEFFALSQEDIYKIINNAHQFAIRQFDNAQLEKKFKKIVKNVLS